jgi:hypothetical protein
MKNRPWRSATPIEVSGRWDSVPAEEADVEKLGLSPNKKKSLLF